MFIHLNWDYIAQLGGDSAHCVGIRREFTLLSGIHIARSLSSFVVLIRGFWFLVRIFRLKQGLPTDQFSKNILSELLLDWIIFEVNLGCILSLPTTRTAHCPTFIKNWGASNQDASHGNMSIESAKNRTQTSTHSMSCTIVSQHYFFKRSRRKSNWSGLFIRSLTSIELVKAKPQIAPAKFQNTG